VPPRERARAERWWFGALCEQCGNFVPVARDPSDGKAGEHVGPSGTVILQCRNCGRRASYRTFDLVQRRTDRREADSSG
jgi:hypothetical protein